MHGDRAFGGTKRAFEVGARSERVLRLALDRLMVGGQRYETTG